MGDIMNFLKYLALTILIIGFLYIIIISIKSRKPIKFLLSNALLGITILFTICLTRKFTSVNLPINEYTVIGSSIFGVPFVIGFLILNLFLMWRFLYIISFIMCSEVIKC